MAAPALLIAAFLFIPVALAGTGATFSLDLHHRFSDTVRRWIESRHPPPPGGAWRWPERGTFEYYAALARHDLTLRGRALSGGAAKAPLEATFSGGNETLAINSLGFLHYATVTVGTPGLSFLVALDTGSDLFWLPCDCSRCAPTASSAYGYGNQEFEFSIYSPSTSMTSQAVLCNSSSCELQSKCSRGNPYCPYEVAYVSADTSSSGYLVEDVLSLTTEDAHPELVQAQIMFGCGQVQTGSFLDAAAPNGLFGLGMEKISVPSILASAGLISDSFSMCFGSDSVGRISFGDQGSSDQEETPFILKQSHSTYNISMTGVAVGNSSITADFSALVDSGTSFTYLADPAYTFISHSFNASVNDKRYPSDPNIPFEYCYHISSNLSMQIPDISLTTKGGGQFPVSDPIVIVTTQRRENVYCLALVKSRNLNIIGQNFLTGLRIVFDRERMVLGWKKFNCYDVEESNPLPVNPRIPGNSSSSSAPTPSPKSYSPEATKETGNGTQVTVLTPSESSWSARSASSSMSLIVLLLAIIL